MKGFFLIPLLALLANRTAYGHGGDNIDHTNYVSSQLPSSLSDTSGGGGGTAISGEINIARPTGGGSFSSAGSGVGAAPDMPADSGSHIAPLAAPGKSSGEARSVPGFGPTTVNLDHQPLAVPRTAESRAILQNAYNADTALVNQWLKSLGN